MMKRSRLLLVFWIVLLPGIGFLGACSPLQKILGPKTVWPGDDWKTSAPERQAMDSGKLNQMMELIEDRQAPIDSVLVIRNGYLVFEQYRQGYDQDRRHHIQSVTKSFTATLVGVAIQEGYIQDVNQRLVDFYPGRSIANLDLRKQNITIKNLLTMSEGLDWHETDLPYDHPDNTLGQMWGKEDVVQHVLDQPMVRDPGQAWNYNSGTSILLGNIIEKAAGQDLLNFAKDYLFTPLGITDLYWAKADAQHFHADGGLYLRPRDMARLGYLMLREGKWDGRQILPPDWVAEATSAYYQTTGNYGYGYQWWRLPQEGIYFASGHYGQAIYVVPEADLVVVFTANIPDESIQPEEGLLLRYILGACTDLPGELSSQSYADFGFAFDVGREFYTIELPRNGSTEISPAAGAVQFSFISYPIELISVSWDDTSFGLDPAAVLQKTFLPLVSQFGVELTGQDPHPLKLNNKILEVHDFKITTQGINLAGVVGVWTCDTSDRSYVLSYLTDSDPDGADLPKTFQEIFASFSCQATPQ